MCIHELFEEQVRQRPDAAALRFEGESLTYGELNRRANRVAHALRGRGVTAATPVAVCVERSPEMLVGLLGVLKAGGYYVPIDPAYPEAQRLFVVRDTAAPLVLVQRAGAGLWPAEVPTLVLDGNPELDRMPTADLRPVTGPGSLMYTIFTSGSTGRPKGVMVEHAGVINRLRWMSDAYGLDHSDVFLQKTPYNFDVSVWELFLPLMIGAPLVIARPGGHRESSYLVDTIRRDGVTAVHFVPSMLRAFLDDEQAATCTSLRNVFASGEALSRSTQDRFYETFDIPLHNLYGPTEASIDALAWTCRPDDPRPYVPIGTPIDNMQALVLDEELNVVPTGTVGELYLGGIGLARGYLDRPRLTADAFVPNPFDSDSTARLYRTGDLARQHVDGTVEFLGRRDHQVKIRGFRIELGEIESALNRHPSVSESVVTAEATGNEELQQLVAYLLPADGAEVPDRGELEAHVGSSLPSHMVPTRFYAVDSFPTTANGKLDRSAFSRAAGLRRLGGPVRSDPAPAPSALLDAVVAVWADVLGVDDVGPDDDFFELGGDSIVALQMVTRMRRDARLRTSARAVLESRTPRAVVARGSVAATASVAQEPVSGPARLTPIQRWFFDKPLAAPQHWNMSLAVEIRSPLDPERLSSCLDRLLDHHDQLRARFRRDAADGGWAQAVPAEGEAFPLHVHNLSGLPAAAQDATFLTLADEAQAGLDLERGPLATALYARFEPVQRDRLVLVFHHLVMDGVSWRIILDDLAALYDGAELPEKTAAFRDWANCWDDLPHQEVLEPDVRYWSDRESPRAAPLPKDGGDGDNSTPAGSLTVQLDESRTERLVRSAPIALATTTEEILVACLLDVIARWSGSDLVHLDLEGHGREPLVDGLDVSRTVGWFTSIYPVELDLRETDPSAGPCGLLPLVGQHLDAIPHRGVGYGILRYGRARPELAERLTRWRRPDLKFNYLGRLDLTSAASPFRLLPGGAGRDVDPLDPVGHSLDVTALVADGRLSIDWVYSREHSRRCVERLADELLRALESLIDGADQTSDTGRVDVLDATGVGLDVDDLARIREALEVRMS